MPDGNLASLIRRSVDGRDYMHGVYGEFSVDQCGQKAFPRDRYEDGNNIRFPTSSTVYRPRLAQCASGVKNYLKTIELGTIALRLALRRSPGFRKLAESVDRFPKLHHTWCGVKRDAVWRRSMNQTIRQIMYRSTLP